MRNCIRSKLNDVIKVGSCFWRIQRKCLDYVLAGQAERFVPTRNERIVFMSNATSSSLQPKSPARPRKPILRWGGILADTIPINRRIILALITLCCLAISFSQFGFAGIGLPGEYKAYAVTLLLPVALTALLFGTWRGALMGLFAGCILYIHAIWMPLDYYELEFVSAFVGFVMFPLAGFALGLAFALAFRKEHGVIRHSIYIVISNFIVSIMFSASFAVNVFIRAITYAADNDLIPDGTEEIGDEVINQLIFMMTRTGDIFEQMWVDGVAMSAICILALIIVRKLKDLRNKKHSVYQIFNVWLAAAVIGTFLVTTTASFVGITLLEIEAANKTADEELGYLYDQFSHRDDKLFLDGYKPDIDGLILFTFVPLETGQTEIFLDNLPQNVHKEIGNLLLSDVLTADAIKSIQQGAESGEYVRVLYDENYAEYSSSENPSEMLDDEDFGKTELRYAKSLVSDNGITVTYIAPAERIHAERPATMLFVTLSIALLLLVVFLITSRLLKNTVVSHIDETNDTLAKIANGDVSIRAKSQDSAEFQSLADSINTTVSALDNMIKEAETRRDAELATAKAIQEDALPMDFPAFPHIDKFDIYASMKTAKEVGGDFYDFFEIGSTNEGKSGKIAMIMADVSGKGIPAALTMMAGKSQLRNYLEAGLPVNEAVEATNHQLCLGNDAGMFITALVWVMDYETGHIEYVNAGHNPPLLCHDGIWEWKKDISGIPLGLFDGISYKKFDLDLAEGDSAYLYTDGVTEAMDSEEKLFGERRLEETLKLYTDMNPRTICVGVRRALTDFTRDAEQSDDITMLCVKYGVPPEEKAIMTLPAEKEQLKHVVNYLHAELARRKAPKSIYNQIDIAAEELFVNIASYAYADRKGEDGEVRVMFDYTDNPPTLLVQFADDGVSYNPLEKEDVILPENLDDMTIGGYGIWMAKNCVDEMTYERIDNSNVIAFKKSW